MVDTQNETTHDLLRFNIKSKLLFSFYIVIMSTFENNSTIDFINENLGFETGELRLYLSVWLGYL